MKQSSQPTSRSKRLDKRDKTPAAGPHGKEELTDPNKTPGAGTTHARINRGQHNRLTTAVHWRDQQNALRDRIGKWLFLLALGGLIAILAYLIFGLNP